MDLRKSLRAQQVGRCYFCRQLVDQERRNACEDIEHYLDKSKPAYRKWAFSPVNLTMACHPCNMQKGNRDLGDAAIRASQSLRTGSGSFKWLHPYFDDFHLNIEIHPGWVYAVKPNAPKAAEATAMIVDLELDQIKRIQRTHQNLCERIGRASILLDKLIDLKQFDSVRMKKLTAIIRSAKNELQWL
ncbi:hypothetical protein ACC713_29495 [Rhizobium johnstonii]|uniref:hypothetical protein n=1 Tax=Rhizobium johnstonii TaxID=3019933 RepID=UPI003F9E5D8B